MLRRIPVKTRGKYRLARLLLGSDLDRSNEHIVDCFGFRYLVPSLRDSVAFTLLVDGVYEATELNFVMSQVEEGDTFVDVGANIGCYSLPVARKVGARGKVLAIEASPKIYGYLTENVRENALSNICAIEAALLDIDGESQFHDAPADHSGMGSIAPQFGATPIAVAARRLDTLVREVGISKVKIIKADVEGYESHVFKGAQELLTGESPPLIVFEFVDWAENRALGRVGDAQQVLRNFGYLIWVLDDYLAGRAPLREIITRGFHTLVAAKSRPA
ncbi:MAG: FkbM family methyltransferase [Pseudomonadota bacterium]|nr:FkbM family methyltransferase [Pseudomonadota bacterium]